MLINQSHTYSDICFPINHKEKRFYEAIDGRLTVAQLMRKVGIRQRERLRPFVQNLWWHDQIIFEVMPGADQD